MLPTTDLPSSAARGAALELPRRAPGGTFNVATLLVDRHVAEGRGGRPALRLGERAVTYAALQALANRAGNALRSAGVEPEQRVALLLPDGVEFVAGFLGALRIGAVPVPLNTFASAGELAFFLADSRACALVTTPALMDRVPANERTGLLKAIFVVGPGKVPGGERGVAQSWDEALAAAAPELQVFATRVDEPCYWLYSSGTTGQPKGTVHLHGDMLACVVPYAEEVLRITPDDVTFSVSRLFFSYGLVNSLFLPLFAGGSVVLAPERPDREHVLRVVRHMRPTLFFSVPTSYAALCAAIESEPRRDEPFSSVRLAISAGEPLPGPVYRRWVRLTGVELLDGIGSTEVGYIYCSNLPGRVRPGSSGVLLGDHQARIVDEHGRDVAPGQPGELWVRAESTALHYWNQRARSKDTFVGHWLRTGDRYRRDDDGYYWHLGRTDDVFKVSGLWVSPLEVESCLLEHPAVAECAVVGEADGDGLVKPKAYVVRHAASIPVVDAAALQAHVRTRLPPHTCPRWIVFVPQLPKTATGKVQRYKLRAAGA